MTKPMKVNKKNTISFGETNLVVNQFERKAVSDVARRFWIVRRGGNVFYQRDFFEALNIEGFDVEVVDSFTIDWELISGGTFVLTRNRAKMSKALQSVPRGSFAHYHIGSPCQGDLRVIDSEGVLYESHYNVHGVQSSTLTYSCVDGAIDACERYFLLVHFGPWDERGQFYPLPMLEEGRNDGIPVAEFCKRHEQVRDLMRSNGHLWKGE